MKKKILYVEDEPFLGKIVKESLELRGFDVSWTEDGRAVMAALEANFPDICVLDVMLPGVDGFSLAGQIRQRHPRLPIIFLTAKTQTEDILKGFGSGGTDYLRKPFSVEELVARINSQLLLLGNVQSSRHELQASVSFRNFCFHPARLELESPSGTIKLSHRESQVLGLLVRHQNRMVDRKELLLEVWGDDSFFNSRTLDVYIRKLREYLSGDPAVEIITLKGKGYHFVVG